MWLVVRDGIRRWWGIYLIAAMGTVFAIFSKGQPELKVGLMAGVIIYANFVLFGIESSGAVKFRTLSLLPLSAMQCGRAFVVLFAVVTAAFNTLLYLLCAALHVLMPGHIPAPVPLPCYAVVIFFTVGVVCLLIQISVQESRCPRGWAKMIWENLLGALAIFVCFVAACFIYRLGLEKEPPPLQPEVPLAWIATGITRLLGPKSHRFDLPDCIGLAVALISIAYTLLRADHFGRFLSNLALRRENDEAMPIRWFSTRTYGFFESWVIQVQNGLRIAATLTISLTVAALLVKLLLGVAIYKEVAAADWLSAAGLVAGLVCIPSAVPWLQAARILRVLPMSRARLALYLMSFPLLAFTGYSAILLIVSAHFCSLDYVLGLEWLVLTVFGIAVLTCALLLHSRSIWVHLMGLFAPTVLTVLVLSLPRDPILAIAHAAWSYKLGVTVPLFVLGYASVYAALKGSTPYRAKPRIE